MGLKRIILFAAAAAAALALLALLLDRGRVRFNYPSLDEFPVQGVDVSHHQKEIDWSRLKGPRVRFAYIKASEGGDFRDPRFHRNWTGAVSAGVVPGAYHFFTLCKSGEVQAQNFLDALADAPGASLPPAVDLEFGGNCGKRPSPEEFERELLSFIAAVEKERKCAPVLYVTREFYDAYVEGRFPNRPLWVRDIYRRPELDGAEWQFWQFANRGRMPGVGPFIDLNVFHGSAEQFERFRCPPTPPPPLS